MQENRSRSDRQKLHSRRLFLVTLGSAATVGLAGCSGNESGSSPEDDESSSNENDGGSESSPDEDESTSSENSGESESSPDEDESSSSENGETSGGDSESLVVGESYTNPIGNTLNVTDIELRDTIRAKPQIGDGDFYQKEPEEGEQWAVVTLEATNDSGQTQYLPPSFQIKVRADDTEYQSTAINNDEDIYRPDEVQDGESRAGWLVYGVPAELTIADIEVVHSNSADGESWTVTWSEG